MGPPPVPTQSKKRSKARLASSPSVSPSFHRFRRFTISDGSYELQYTERLHSDISEKAVFKALIRASGADTIVVVKFGTRYCQRAHQLFGGSFIGTEALDSVLMDYAEGRCVDDMSSIPLKA